MILAGDIGGTKTNICLCEFKSGKYHEIKSNSYPSANYSSLEAIIKEFLSEEHPTIKSAAFGIAGPIKEQKCETINLPWKVNGNTLKAIINTSQVHLLNDVESNAFGIEVLSDKDFHVLNVGAPIPGNRGVISAGTGLGQSGIYWDGTSYHPFACEGGHSDYSPKTEEESALMLFLKKEFGGHVSWERLLSGPGISNIYQFFRETGRIKETAWFENVSKGKDRAAAIAEVALTGNDPLCVKTLNTFTSIYGSEAGNLALKMMALSGIYIGGGIAPKILPFLEKDIFISSFKDKGRLSPLLENIPVKVILNDKTALYGAALVASRLV